MTSNQVCWQKKVGCFKDWITTALGRADSVQQIVRFSVLPSLEIPRDVHRFEVLLGRELGSPDNVGYALSFDGLKTR